MFKIALLYSNINEKIVNYLTELSLYSNFVRKIVLLPSFTLNDIVDVLISAFVILSQKKCITADSLSRIIG